MAFEVGEPSHARGEAAARQQRPSWVALSTIPIVVGANDERAKKIDEAGTDLRLDLHHPPRPTHLVVPACQEEGTCDAEYFLLDAHTRSGARLPADLGVRLHPQRRSVGLAANPHRLGHFIVAQLNPPSATRFETLIYFCTATMKWATKALASSPTHEPWASHGVLALDGLLWWVNVARGILVCDPFLRNPHLRLVPLPDGCEIDEPVRSRTLLDKRRFVRPSEGKLYFVEVRGIAAADGQECPGVWIWSLVDSDRAPNWSLDFVASFADIWIDASYIAAGLTPGNVPALALLDPTDHGVVFFFEGASLFGLDVRAGRVVACKHECYLDQSNRDDTKFQFSRFVDAWEIPPFPYSELSSDGLGYFYC
ncbi:unnamed protein product [Urochloa decumbens]|uniref:DUF1618 domain-containing protein n=1 Tax=Urochloa decumbens TaxID=240449 RepID=A0ABC8ZW11_9POAL